MSLRRLSTIYSAVLLAGWVLLSVQLAARAESSLSHFEQANQLYEQKKFSEAITLYESMVKAGRHSGAIFFNLGNAYFKNGDLGRALYNYRRAERLSPRDPDIKANLRFTRERVASGVSVTTSAWIAAVNYFTLDEITVACALLFWLWAALFSLARLRPDLRAKFRTLTLVLGTCLGVLALVLALSYLAHTRQIAIVAVQQTPVRLGPLPESQASFTASEGSELHLLRQREHWILVSDRSNRSGWVLRTNVLIF